MAILDTGRRRSNYSQTPQAPHVPVEKFGVEGDALAKVGATIQNIGVDLVRRQTETKENDYLYKSQMSDLDKMSAWKAERLASIKSAEDAELFEQDAIKYIQQLRDENLKNAPTKRAAEEYQRKSLQYYTKELIDIRRESQKQQGFFKEKDIDDISDKDANNLVLNPNKEKALIGIRILEDRIEKDRGKLFTPEYATRVLDRNSNKIAMGLFKGYLQSEDPAILELGKKQLGEIEKGEIGSYITPEQRAVLLNSFNSAITQEHRKSVSRVGRELDDAMAMISDGVVVPGQTFSGITQRLDTAYKAKAIDKDTYERMKISASSLSKANFIIADMKTKPASEWKSADSLVPKGLTFGYKEADQIRTAVQRAQEAELEKRHADFPSYAVQNSPKLSNLLSQAMGGENVDAYAVELEAQANAMGIPQDKRRFLPKTVTSQLGAQLTTLNNPEQKTAMLENLQRQFGKNWTKAFADLAEDKVIPGEYLAAAYMVDHGTKAKAFTNIVNEPSIREAFKKNFGNVSDTNVIDELLGERPDLQILLIGKGGDPARMPYANAMLGQLTTELKTRALKENKAPNSTMAKSVLSDFIDKNFNTVAAGNSKVMIPRGTVSPDAVEKFLDVTSTPTGLSLLDLQPPSNGQSLDDYRRGLSRVGFWDLSPANDALMLYAPGPDGLPREVPDRNGNPIVIPFEKLDSYSLELESKSRAIEIEKKSIPIRNTTARAIEYFNRTMGKYNGR